MSKATGSSSGRSLGSRTGQSSCRTGSTGTWSGSTTGCWRRWGVCTARSEKALSGSASIAGASITGLSMVTAGYWDRLFIIETSARPVTLPRLDELVGLGRIYDATGTQAMAINTICQLLAERGSTAYGVASHLLMVPDLLAYLLTGQRRLERTIASTTQLVDARTGGFVEWLFPLLGLRREIFGAAIEPGEHYGEILPAVAASAGMAPPPSVVAVASHDTASAVLAVPALTEDFAYVSSGTWSLVGLELAAPVITEASRKANFSNELGYGGTVRFLKNVMGYWMIQESERCWARQGRTVRLAEIFDEAEACPPFRSLVDTTDPVFAVPGDMPARIRQACAANGEPVPESEAELVRCVLDSVALAICSTLEDAQRCAGKHVSVLHVVGGGSANRLFLSLLAACSGLEVVAGPREATAIGNLLAQLGSAGKVADQAEMRQLVARSFPIAHVLPDPSPGPSGAAGETSVTNLEQRHHALTERNVRSDFRAGCGQ